MRWSRGKILLHVGMGKTGSSALQVAFVKNRPLLARKGWTYPSAGSDAIAAKDGVVSGNGGALVELLLPRKSPGGLGVDELLDRATAAVRDHDRRSSLLFSSEFLHQFEEDRLVRLRQSCEELGYQLHAVGYVRDIAGHALSDYSQRVKRHRLTDGFGTFLRGGGAVTYRPAMREWVEPMCRVLGTESVTIYRYDSLRPMLVPHFFEHQLGIKLRRRDDAVQRDINRSLTPAEINLMRAINELLRTGAAGKLVSDTIISGAPLHPGKPVISSADLQVLADRFGEEVAWLNASGIQGGPLQFLPPGMEEREATDDRALTEEEQLLVRLVADMANRNIRLRRRVG